MAESEGISEGTAFSYTVTEGKPCEIVFANEDDNALVALVSIDKVDPANPTTLECEYLDYDDEETDIETAKLVQKKQEIAKFDTADKLEKDVEFLCEASMKPKIIVTGPGEVKVQGMFAPRGTFADDEEEEEEGEPEPETK